MVDAVRLAVTEAVTNVVRHAYPSGGGAVEVRVDLETAAMVVHVCDHGIGMPLQPRGDPGFGLQLMDALVTRWSVSPRDPGTRMSLLFELGPPG